MTSCNHAAFITAVACNLFNSCSTEELSLLAADLVQLADTLSAMLVRAEICDNPEQ